MPLISLTAAQHTTFLTHAPSCDPSSRAAPSRHTQYLRLRRNAGMYTVRNAGRRWGGRNGNLHGVNILFHVRGCGGCGVESEDERT